MRNPPILVLLVGAAFLLRLLFAATQATDSVYLERSGDEYRYLKLGYDLITGRTYTDMGISSAPLYPLGVGVILRPFLLPQTPAQIAAMQAGEELPREILRDTAAPILHPARLGGGIGSGARLAGLPRRLALERGRARGHVGRSGRGHCARFHPRGGGHRHGNALYDFAGGGASSCCWRRANGARARTS